MGACNRSDSQGHAERHEAAGTMRTTRLRSAAPMPLDGRDTRPGAGGHALNQFSVYSAPTDGRTHLKRH